MSFRSAAVPALLATLVLVATACGGGSGGEADEDDDDDNDVTDASARDGALGADGALPGDDSGVTTDADIVSPDGPAVACGEWSTIIIDHDPTKHVGDYPSLLIDG